MNDHLYYKDRDRNNNKQLKLTDLFIIGFSLPVEIEEKIFKWASDFLNYTLIWEYLCVKKFDESILKVFKYIPLPSIFLYKGLITDSVIKYNVKFECIPGPVISAELNPTAYKNLMAAILSRKIKIHTLGIDQYNIFDKDFLNLFEKILVYNCLPEGDAFERVSELHFKVSSLSTLTTFLKNRPPNLKFLKVKRYVWDRQLREEIQMLQLLTSISDSINVRVSMIVDEISDKIYQKVNNFKKISVEIYTKSLCDCAKQFNGAVSTSSKFIVAHPTIDNNICGILINQIKNGRWKEEQQDLQISKDAIYQWSISAAVWLNPSNVSQCNLTTINLPLPKNLKVADLTTSFNCYFPFDFKNSNLRLIKLYNRGTEFHINGLPQSLVHFNFQKEYGSENSVIVIHSVLEENWVRKVFNSPQCKNGYFVVFKSDESSNKFTNKIFMGNKSEFIDFPNFNHEIQGNY